MQKSIDQSVFKTVRDIIEKYEIGSDFDIQKTVITNKTTGYRFIFHGLRDYVVDNIKSIKGITEVWAEEAHSISAESWRVLEPTIREQDCCPYPQPDGSIKWGDSEIWINFNRKRINDPVWERFCKTPRPDIMHVTINWYDNPFFPKVLLALKDREYQENFELAEHTWGGKPLTVEGLVYPSFNRQKHLVTRLEANNFENKADIVSLGVDWGFDHPMAMVRIARNGERYMITGAYRKREQTINVKWLFNDLMPFANSATLAVADSARPELIQYCDSGYKDDTTHVHDIRFQGAYKYAGSVLAEINTINKLLVSNRLFIAEDLHDLIEEFETWLWQKDRRNETPYPLNEDILRAMGYGIMYHEQGTGSLSFV